MNLDQKLSSLALLAVAIVAIVGIIIVITSSSGSGCISGDTEMWCGMRW